MPLKIRPQRTYQRRDAPLRLLADAARRRIKRPLKEALALLDDNFDVEIAIRLARSGRWSEISREAIRWGHFREVLREPFGRMADAHQAGSALAVRRINRAFQRQGRSVMFGKKSPGPGTGGVGGTGPGAVEGGSPEGDAVKIAGWQPLRKAAGDRFNFDRFDPATQAFMRAEQDRLIRELEATARATINSEVQAAMRAGVGPGAIVGEIRSVIGLTDRQAQAVRNYRAMLETLDPQALARQLRNPQYDAAFQSAIADGTYLGDAMIEEMVADYEDRYLDYRADTIAGTESVRMTNQGLQDAYRQAIDRGALPADAVRQFWEVDLDERTCEICVSIPDMNPDGVPIGEPFDSEDGPQDGPPIHPNCRCSVDIVTDISMVPED